jgi:hypothetical protein
MPATVAVMNAAIVAEQSGNKSEDDESEQRMGSVGQGRVQVSPDRRDLSRGRLDRYRFCTASQCRTGKQKNARCDP